MHLPTEQKERQFPQFLKKRKCRLLKGCVQPRASAITFLSAFSCGHNLLSPYSPLGLGLIFSTCLCNEELENTGFKHGGKGRILRSCEQLGNQAAVELERKSWILSE